MAEEKKWKAPVVAGFSVLVTLVAALVVLFVVFLILSFVAPAAMSRLTGDIGMYKCSAWYASLQYADGAGDIEYAERAMEMSARAGNEEGVVRYGVAFLSDERFSTYCAEKESSEEYILPEKYGQHVYGRVGVAHYRVGHKDEGLELVFSVNTESFDKYNAVTDLGYEIIVCKDAEFLNTVYERLSLLDTSSWDEASKANILAYRQTLSARLAA